MNQDEIELERRLTEATAPTAGKQQPADAETAALAEGWQLLGQLLDAANSDFRPEPVIRQLRWWRLKQRLWLAAGALAAALLIGVGITWYANHNGAANQLPGRTADQVVATPPKRPIKKSDSSLPAPAESITGNQGTIAAASHAEHGGGWDAVDEQITQVDQSVKDTQTLATTGDDQIEQLGEQLVSLRQELKSNSL